MVLGEGLIDMELWEGEGFTKCGLKDSDRGSGVCFLANLGGVRGVVCEVFCAWVVCEGWSSSGATAEVGCLLSLLFGSSSPDEEGIWPRGPRRRCIEVQSAEVCYKCQATFSCLCRFIS